MTTESDADYERSTRTAFNLISAIVLLGLVFVGVGYWQSLPPVVQVRDGELSVSSGFYDSQIEVAQIDSVALLGALPAALTRANGFEFGRYRRGLYASPGDSKVELFVTAGAPPYIEVRSPGRWLLVNLEDSAETSSLYAELVRARTAP